MDNAAVGNSRDSLPELSPGIHLSPQEGACFMEFASLLAGERWSDHPRCTHPALAELARLVNDACPPRERPRLARWVPDVIGVAGRDARVAPALVILCAHAAEGVGRPLERAERRAGRRLERVSRHRWGGGWCALTDRTYRRGPARRAMCAAVARVAARDPSALVPLLAQGIRVSRALLTAPPSAPLTPVDRPPTSGEGTTERSPLPEPAPAVHSRP